MTTHAIRRFVAAAGTFALAAALVGCASETPGTAATGDAGSAPAVQAASSQSASPSAASLPFSTNYASSLGKFVYADGCTYFWDHALDNDASVTGFEDSVNIYRIGEGADDVEELLCVLPCPVVAGTVQDTAPIVLLGSGAGRIYYYSPFDYDNLVLWVSTDGSQRGTVDCDLPGKLEPHMTRYIVDGTDVYITGACEVEENNFRGVSYVLDMEGGSVSEFKGAQGDPIPSIRLTVADGNIYLLKIKTNSDGTPVVGEYGPELIGGLYRQRISDGGLEEVGAVEPQQMLPIANHGAFCAVTSRYFYYQLEEDLMAIDLADGHSLTVLQGVFDYEFPFCNVTEDAVYYVAGDGGALWACDPDGANPHELMPAAGDGSITRLAVSDGWFYYYVDLEGGWGYTSRVARDARFFTNNPIGSPYEYVEYQEQTEGDWAYVANNKFAVVCGYTGGESSVTVPETIGGLPVYAVKAEFWGEPRWPGVTEIWLPSTIKAVHGMYVPGLAAVHIPANDVVFTHSDFDHTFWNGSSGMDVYYEGTCEQWAQCLDRSLAMYDGVGIEWQPRDGDFRYAIHCSDGDTDYMGESSW